MAAGRRPATPSPPSPSPGPGRPGRVVAFLERRGVLAKLALALLVPAVLLGVAELGLRAAGRHTPTRLYLPVPDQHLYGANRTFGWRFFPRAIARKPVFQAFAQERDPAVCRIFVLGASAALGVPNAAFSFAQQLDVMLTTLYPDVTFEVVNTSLVAINSHVVRPIGAECAGYEPDLFVIYLGNNEVIGPWGVGAARGGRATPLWAIRTSVALQATAVGQAVRDLATKLQSGDQVPKDWGGMAQYTRNLVAADDPVLDRVDANFRSNLDDVCRFATDAGARVILSTVAVNLKDSPPFASVGDSLLPPDVRAEWRAALARGASAQDGGREAAALPDLRRAAELCPAHAETRFRLGRALLTTGEVAGARVEFLAALEEDALRFRTDRRRNDVVRAVARDYADRGVYLVDAADSLARHEPSGTGLPGAELFYEHVHLNFVGNYLVARALLPQVEAALPPRVGRHRRADVAVPGLTDCARALAFTPWNEYKNLAQMRTMIERYPFTAQVAHRDSLAALDARLAAMRAGASAEQARVMLEVYAAAHRARPRDLLLALNFAKLLHETGNQAAAQQLLDGILAMQPPMPADEVQALLRGYGGG